MSCIVRRGMLLALVFGVCLVLLAGGCQPTISEGPVRATVTDPLTVSGADLQRNTEVQLVEQMALHRSNYRSHLLMMMNFYDQQGNHMKANWARQELEYLEMGPQREYLVIAEVAGPDLQASQSIPQADTLYQEGLKLVREGRGGLGKLFMDRKKILSAKGKFDELITNYPDSDKIDDAAFQIAEIYRYYLDDNPRAMLYYQRVWQWDSQTPLPARFAVAQLYDDYLHDRIKALEYYVQAINLESNYPENMVYARRRVEQINAELSRP